MPLETEDLARTALVRLLPRGRYRIAPPNDSRFAAFAPQTVRLAYRQQGAQPGFVLFCGPGQDVRAAALAAAEWAAANWRPNAVQRRVRPGVIAVQVAPATQLVPAGQVAGAAVPTAIWTVDADSARCVIAGGAPGAPAGGEIRRAADALARGLPPPPLGELDFAERELMHPRSRPLPGAFSGGLAILLLLFALRFGFSALSGLYLYGTLLTRGLLPGLALAGLAVNLLLLAGIALAAALLLNFQQLAVRAPGFSSPVAATRTASWAGFVIAMAVLAGANTLVLPQALRGSSGQGGVQAGQHVLATVADDGAQAAVLAGGEVRVDLSGWPAAEWPGVRFRTSNPSVLALRGQSIAGQAPEAVFAALAGGSARVDATSADGRYTFELRVTVAG